jgi:hypothetical protein
MVRIQILPQGARVAIRKGHFPIDPALVGRTGTVIHLMKNSAAKYGIQLDGETQIRVFTEDELETRG